MTRDPALVRVPAELRMSVTSPLPPTSNHSFLGPPTAYSKSWLSRMKKIPTSMMSLRIHYLNLGSAPSSVPWGTFPKRTSMTALGLITYFLLMLLYRTTPLDPFIKVARWIGRSQDPFTNFYSIIYTTLNEDEESHSSDSEVESASRYCMLCIPDIQLTSPGPGRMKPDARNLSDCSNSFLLLFLVSMCGWTSLWRARRIWTSFASGFAASCDTSISDSTWAKTDPLYLYRWQTRFRGHELMIVLVLEKLALYMQHTRSARTSLRHTLPSRLQRTPLGDLIIHNLAGCCAQQSIWLILMLTAQSES